MTLVVAMVEARRLFLSLRGFLVTLRVALIVGFIGIYFVCLFVCIPTTSQFTGFSWILKTLRVFEGVFKLNQGNGLMTSSSFWWILMTYSTYTNRHPQRWNGFSLCRVTRLLCFGSPDIKMVSLKKPIYSTYIIRNAAVCYMQLFLTFYGSLTLSCLLCIDLQHEWDLCSIFRNTGLVFQILFLH